MNAIIFEPIYKERVWGGAKLATFLHRTLPENAKIGESWEMVDRDGDQSIVLRGEFKGLTLRDLLRKYISLIMGNNWDSQRPFPILIKWLDCQEKLSLQVHPPREIAPKLKGEPKTENWYIAEASRGAKLMVGLKHGISKQDFIAALANNTLEKCVHEVNVRKGDSLFVPSGRIHAIGAGNVILEIQQNSDTTYRVYDWGRVGLDGKPREMHVKEALESIDFNDFEPEVLHSDTREKKTLLVDSDVFRLERLQLDHNNAPILFKKGEQPRILSVVEGSIVVNGEKCVLGSNILLPYAGEFQIKAASGEATVLLTSNFAR